MLSEYEEFCSACSGSEQKLQHQKFLEVYKVYHNHLKVGSILTIRFLNIQTFVTSFGIKLDFLNL